jgi:hypothetical protein
MQFVNFLRSYLERHGQQVVFDLNDDDIDVIIHIAAFPFLFQNAKYSLFSANIYKLRHPNCMIIARINECDERKGTHYVNNIFALESYFSDVTVYISEWLKKLYLNRYKFLQSKQIVLIRNGADPKVFFPGKSTFKGGKLKIVTHHWSSHFLKGHDVYQVLDKLLDDKEFSNKFEFTYVGNLGKNLKFKNTRVIPPLSGDKLADELRRHHVYITGTRNEPAGMHHIEGAMCGLPVLYVDSGSTVEFAAHYGIEINPQNIKPALLKMRTNYLIYRNKITKYPFTAEKMAASYLQLITKISQSKPVGVRGYDALFVLKLTLFYLADLGLALYSLTLLLSRELVRRLGNYFV